MVSITRCQEINPRTLARRLLQSAARLSIRFIIKDSHILIMLGPDESFDKLKEEEREEQCQFMSLNAPMAESLQNWLKSAQKQPRAQSVINRPKR